MVGWAGQHRDWLEVMESVLIGSGVAFRLACFGCPFSAADIMLSRGHAITAPRKLLGFASLVPEFGRVVPSRRLGASNMTAAADLSSCTPRQHPAFSLKATEWYGQACFKDLEKAERESPEYAASVA